MLLLKISCKLSSGHHPHFDGQIECTNQTLEQYRRCFITYKQDDWIDTLHFAELIQSIPLLRSHNNNLYASLF